MAKTISSPLIAAANSISLMGNTSSRNFSEVKKSYKGLIDFLDINVEKIESIKLPKQNKIKELANINIASNFGSAGNLLKNLASGAFDAASFVSNFFPGGGDVGKPKGPAGKPKAPTALGSKLRFSGFRSIGIANAIFAGLDFATGLQEGESVGKAAAGAGGSLAGSLLGGVIGTALIPFPPLGFIVGSAIGGMAGGWLGDRASEAASGKSDLQKKQEERLKAQEERQKSLAQDDKRVPALLRRFSESVDNFEKFANKTFRSIMTAAGAEDIPMDYGIDETTIQDTPILPGELQDIKAEGGKLPSRSIKSSPYGPRWGRMHRGVDYAEPGGTPISVIQPGKVVFAGWNDGGYGNLVLVSHPGGDTTAYAHLSKISVKQGQTIDPGTVIGNVGTTGRSTGDHLHFEIRRGGSQIPITFGDGDKYFRFGGNVKVVSKKPAGMQSGVPTAVITPGTNDTDPKKAAENIKKSIEDLKSKGYNVVVVPPSQQQGGVGEAIEQTARQSGATVEKASNMDATSMKSLQEKYKGARFIGDENKGSENILKQVQSMQKVRAVGGAELDISSMTPEQIQEYQQYVMGVPMNQMVQAVESYPAYNAPGQSSMTYIPIMMGSSGGGSSPQRPVVISGGGGGGGTVILPGPTEGQVVNSLMKTMLLTNLSGS